MDRKKLAMIKESINVYDLETGETKLMFLPKSIISEIHDTTKDIDPKNELLVITKTSDGYEVEKKQKLMTERQLKRELKAKYPESVFDDGYNYHPDYKGCIWVRTEVHDEDGESLFDIVAYSGGVHPDLQKMLDDAGWFCNWVDSETALICEKGKHD